MFRSGKGGVQFHFHRDKTTCKGGPDGGDGGNEVIILRGNQQMWTALHLRYKKHIFAEHGGTGSGNHKHGKDGESKIIEVPWNVSKRCETGKQPCEITEDRGRICIGKGGIGGRGNSHFKSPTNQSPRYSSWRR